VDTGIEATSTAQAAADPAAVFRLDLRAQGLVAMPTSVFEMPNLTLLNFAGDNLTSIPPEIGTLKNLQVLYLNNNPRLTSLPDEIGNLPDLRMLSLYNDQLTALPPSIANLKNLTLLGLSGNPIAQSSTVMTMLHKELPKAVIN